MERIDNEVLLNQLAWRYAVKKFDSQKKIPAKDWQALEQALVLTPSSYGLQPWRFIVIQDPAIRKQLTPVSWNQTQVEDCSHYVVMTTKTAMDENYVNQFIGLVAKTRGIPAETMEAYRKMMVGDVVNGPRGKMAYEWAARQTYIALGNLMTAAAMLGIDTCPMEGFDPVKYDEILGLKGSGFASTVCCAFGYRSADDRYQKLAKVRFDPSTVIEHR